jgi:Glycogen synthase
LLRHRSHDLSGILNGVDYSVWNPATDTLLDDHYTATRLTGKLACKEGAAKALRPRAEKRCAASAW